MARSERVHVPNVPGLTAEMVDGLLAIHSDKRLELAFTVGMSGAVYLGDLGRQALVTELLRLARTGALAEQTAVSDPTTRVSTVVRAANEVWKVAR